MRGLLVLLVASLVVNAYLIVTRESRLRVSAGPATSKEASGQSTTPMALGHKSQVNLVSLRALDRRVLETRVLAAEAQVQDLMEPEEKYAQQERSPESEDRVKPYLDRIFQNVPGAAPKYRVECHGRVCKIDARRDNAWIIPLQQTFPERTMFGTMSFSDKTFVELLTEGTALANRIHYEAWEAIHECAIANPSEGEVSYQLITGDAHQVNVLMSGSLANQAAGNCVAAALQDAIEKTPMTSNIRIEDREHTLTLPVDE